MMTAKEFKHTLLAARQEAESREQKICEDYFATINQFPIGSKFTDHIGTILVEEIKVMPQRMLLGGFDSRHVLYYGIKLKADGTPFESGEKRWGYLARCIDISKRTI